MKKITQQKIANVLGVKQPTISKYKTGKLELSFKDALELKKHFEWSDGDIISFFPYQNNTINNGNTTSLQG
jgi:transcriptional regulator with XRE-family HTH domain